MIKKAVPWYFFSLSGVFFFFACSQKEGRADAVPTTRNYTPDSPDLDERRGQPHRSAMVRPRPGGTAFVITVTSAPSKFNDGRSNGTLSSLTITTSANQIILCIQQLPIHVISLTFHCKRQRHKKILVPDSLSHTNESPSRGNNLNKTITAAFITYYF